MSKENKELWAYMLEQVFNDQLKLEAVEDVNSLPKLRIEFDSDTKSTKLYWDDILRFESNGYGHDFKNVRAVKAKAIEVKDAGTVCKYCVKELLRSEAIAFTCDGVVVGLIPITYNKNLYHDWRNLLDEYYRSLTDLRKLAWKAFYELMMQAGYINYHVIS